MSLPIIFVFLYGLLWGSFTNVSIYRLPQSMDLVFQRSHCPFCNSLIPWYRNVPLLSFMLQRGKCASCSARIPFRYPLVELMGGVIALCAWWHPEVQENLIWFHLYFIVGLLFLNQFFIDLDHFLLLDVLNLPLAIILGYMGFILNGWEYTAIGLGIGLALPGIVAYLFYKLRGIEGLGMGDIKLYGAVGLYLGPDITHTLFLSCFLGALIGGLYLLIFKKPKGTPIPFGPFIIVVSFIQIFFPALYPFSAS